MTNQDKADLSYIRMITWEGINPKKYYKAKLNYIKFSKVA